MIKRRDSAYQAGRAKGPWFKWKRDPYNIDAVMMYAQRGRSKRSSYYSDFTFGVWAEGEDGEQLVPVGKAYFGFTDAELEVLDKFVRDNTVERFGPVRAVRIRQISVSCWRWLSRASTVLTATNPALPCGFRALRGSAPTNSWRRRIARRRLWR